MAAAGSDFDRSIAMFEKLLVEQAGDPLIRRYLADAVGLGGLGCHMKFTHRSEEAERLYLRAIELRRDLVRGRAPGDVAGARPQVDDPGERENLLLLASTVEIVAHAMDDAGRVSEAKRCAVNSRTILLSSPLGLRARSTNRFECIGLVNSSWPKDRPLSQCSSRSHSRIPN